ncbi:type IV pilus assembly protein PilM [Patescibacteria group bacterium]
MKIPFLEKIGGDKLLKYVKQNDAVLGIDIGTSSLKIIQLRKEKERAVLETYGELSTGPYHSETAGKAALLQEEKVAEMLKDLMLEAGVTASKAVVGIPMRYSFVTLIDLPQLTDAELEEAIPYEARRYIPLPMSEIELEWFRMPTTDEELEKKGGKIPVLLTAVQREIIDRYNDAVKRAKLEIVGHEIEIFSAARSSIGRFRMPIMLIDIGALSLKIAVIDKGHIRMAYNIAKGSQSITVALSQALSIDFERAEEMKREVGISPRPEVEGVRRVITPLIDDLFSEADRLRSLYRRKHERIIEKIIFLGGGSLMPGLLDYAVERFGIEVILANPFNVLEHPTFMQPMMKKISPSFGISVGLALKGL